MSRKDLLVLVLALVAATSAAAGGLRAFRDGDDTALGGGAAGGDTASFGAAIPFSSPRWARCADGHDPDTGERNVRIRMLPVVLASYDLLGWPRGEVEAMLGPPARDPWSELFPNPGYLLGENAKGTPEVLVIRYDDGAAVVGYDFPWGSKGRPCTER